MSRRSIFLAAVVVSMPLLTWPLYPPTAFDATMYHLAVAKIYSAAHRLVLTPDLRYPIFPQTPHMLFTLALLLADDIAAQLTQLLVLVLLSCAMLAFAGRSLSSRAGWLAVRDRSAGAGSRSGHLPAGSGRSDGGRPVLFRLRRDVGQDGA